MKNELDIYEFKDYLKIEKEYSNNTIESYIKDLIQFDEFIDKQIVLLSKDDIDKYLQYLKDNYKENTYLRKVSALKSFNKFLQESKLSSTHIELLEVKKKNKKLPKYLTIDQINNLLDSLNDNTSINSRNKALFEVLYATGMRVSEVINIKLQDVNIENKVIKVFGKGNKDRIVILNTSATNALSNYLMKDRIKLLDEMCEYVFVNNKGKKLTRQGINYLLNNQAKFVGIKEISPHIFRHSIASHMLFKGADLRVIQMILGHENISTTEIYTHINQKQIQGEYDKHHPLSQKKEK